MDFKTYQREAHSKSFYPDLKKLVVDRLQTSGFIVSIDWKKMSLEDMKDWMGITNNIYFPALGLCGEVGEFCNKLKKVMRDSNGEVDSRFLKVASKELGDILWYLSELTSVLGLDLDDIAKQNIDKIQSRKDRGTLAGQGDNR